MTDTIDALEAEVEATHRRASEAKMAVQYSGMLNCATVEMRVSADAAMAKAIARFVRAEAEYDAACARLKGHIMAATLDEAMAAFRTAWPMAEIDLDRHRAQMARTDAHAAAWGKAHGLQNEKAPPA